MLICRYEWIYLDSKMAFLTWHVPVDPIWCPVDPGRGQLGHLFWKFSNDIFSKVTPSLILFVLRCVNWNCFCRRACHAATGFHEWYLSKIFDTIPVASHLLCGIQDFLPFVLAKKIVEFMSKSMSVWVKRQLDHRNVDPFVCCMMMQFS